MAMAKNFYEARVREIARHLMTSREASDATFETWFERINDFPERAFCELVRDVLWLEACLERDAASRHINGLPLPRHDYLTPDET